MQISKSPNIIAPLWLDSTVISLGNTCKEMQALCRVILQDRDRCLESILSEYSCKGKYQVNSFIQAKLFCGVKRLVQSNVKKLRKSLFIF